jgi:hypothetical protein
LDALAIAKTLPALADGVAAHGYASVTLGPEVSREELALLADALARRMGLGERASYRQPIETRPSGSAPIAEPFNRPEAIGWHNDFSTQLSRPELTLALVERSDPKGPAYGAWRAASTELVLSRLQGTARGRRVVALLATTPLPYGFVGDATIASFRPIESDTGSPGRRGLRFYGRAMRDGARCTYGKVPDELEDAIRAIESAADAVGVVLPAHTGALLVTDNWRCLHDRLPQSVDVDLPLRRALLRFVAKSDGVAEPSSASGQPP